MAIDIKLIKKLRDETQASIADCRVVLDLAVGVRDHNLVLEPIVFTSNRLLF